MNNLVESKISAARHIATALDALDRNECDSDSMTAAIQFVMKGLGYAKIYSMAAAIQVTAAIYDDFTSTYWRETTTSHKFATLMGAVETTIQIKEDGQLDEKVINAIKAELEKTELGI